MSNVQEWQQLANKELSRREKTVDSLVQQTAEGIAIKPLYDAPRDKCTLSCAINGIHAAFHYLKKNYISGCVMTVPTG